MKKILLSIFILLTMLGKSFADNYVIKAEKSMLYFAGLYPSYILYLQGGIPENTKDIYSGYSIVGDFLDKTIIKPNNKIFHPSRNDFINLFK